MNVTFIKARVRKDANTPFYHEEYQTTPLWTVKDWEQSKINDCIILNDNQPPITWLSGADWNVDIKRSRAKCLLVISPDDFALLYGSEEQRQSMEKYIEKKLSV